MKKLVMTLVASSVAVVYAQDKPFVYNDHGKHDPFWPLVSPNGTMIIYDSDLSATDMVLEGIVVDVQGNNLAIVNRKIVKKGDRIGPYTVELITNDQVDVVKGQEHLTLKLKKGGV